MSGNHIDNEPIQKRESSRMPADSFLFEKLVPAALFGLAIVMLGLIVFAASVLLGFVSF